MRTCSEDHDQLLILKKHRCSLWHEFGFQPTPGENTSNSILTQCNIKGLKATQEETETSNLHNHDVHKHAQWQVSDATFAGVHDLKWTRGRSFALMAQRTLLHASDTFEIQHSPLRHCCQLWSSALCTVPAGHSGCGIQYTHLFSPQLLTYIHRDNMAQGSGPALGRHTVMRTPAHWRLNILFISK